MITRILAAIPLILLVVAAIFFQGWVLVVFAAVVGLFCAYEVSRALHGTDAGVSRMVSLSVAVCLTALFVSDYALRQNPVNSAALFSPESILLILAAGAAAAFAVCMFSPRGSFGMLENTLFTFVYPLFLVVFFYLLALHIVCGAHYWQGVVAMLMLFVPSALSDTLAYFWGRAFGRRKLCPGISPNKTVAGSAAGLVGGGIGGALVWLLATLAVPEGAPSGALFIVSGFLLAFLSQIGDLAASYIKRAVGVKDFGRLLPGHGGVMDRVDSTLFVAPLVYVLTAAGAFAFH